MCHPDAAPDKISWLRYCYPDLYSLPKGVDTASLPEWSDAQPGTRTGHVSKLNEARTTLTKPVTGNRIVCVNFI